MENMFLDLIQIEKALRNGASQQRTYYTWFEFLVICEKYQITRQTDYNTCRSYDSKLPPAPSKEYQPKWNAICGWAGIVNEYKKPYFSFAHFIELCRTLGVTDKKTYDEHSQKNKKLPPDPGETYKPKWQNAGGWSCLNTETKIHHVHLDREYYSYEEFTRACREKRFTTKNEYHLKRATDPKLPSHPEICYKDVWKEKGGWSRIFLGLKNSTSRTNFKPIKKIETTFDEFVKICTRMKILSRVDYQNRYKQNSKLMSNPEKRYHEWFKRAGGWNFITGKGFYSFDEFIIACKQKNFVSREDYKLRHVSDKKLTRYPSLLYHNEWVNRGAWKCVCAKE